MYSINNHTCLITTPTRSNEVQFSIWFLLIHHCRFANGTHVITRKIKKRENEPNKHPFLIPICLLVISILQLVSNLETRTIAKENDCYLSKRMPFSLVMVRAPYISMPMGGWQQIEGPHTFLIPSTLGSIFCHLVVWLAFMYAHSLWMNLGHHSKRVFLLCLC